MHTGGMGCPRYPEPGSFVDGRSSRERPLFIVVRAGRMPCGGRWARPRSDANRLGQRNRSAAAASCEHRAFTRALHDVGSRLARPLVGGDIGSAAMARRAAHLRSVGHRVLQLLRGCRCCVGLLRRGRRIERRERLLGNFSYSQSMRMLSTPAIPPSAYDADTLKWSTG